MLSLIYSSGILEILADKNNLGVRTKLVDLICQRNTIHRIFAQINIH